ncbi:MAG: homoserine kinase [Hyphomicrobiaceae bacterium]
MAVYTEVPDDEIQQFVDGYGLGEVVSFKGIAEGVENSNYLVVTGAGQYILTLYEKRVDPSDLPFFLGLMEHLSASGFSCPVPLRDRGGHNLRTLCGRPAALVTFLPGLWVRKPKPMHCQLAGEALASLHVAGQSFDIRRKNALGPDGWKPLFDRFADQADGIQSGLRAMISGELDEILPEWPASLPPGVIHADLFPDNIFFRGEEFSGVIDFYFACNDFLAYDIAICLNAWCFEPDFSFNVTKSRALLRGYQRVRPLEETERAALPMLARGAALRFLLTRAYDWLNTSPDAFVKPHDPLDYLRRLRFHQTVNSAMEYGID